MKRIENKTGTAENVRKKETSGNVEKEAKREEDSNPRIFPNIRIFPNMKDGNTWKVMQQEASREEDGETESGRRRANHEMSEHEVGNIRRRREANREEDVEVPKCPNRKEINIQK